MVLVFVFKKVLLVLKSKFCLHRRRSPFYTFLRFALINEHDGGGGDDDDNDDNK